MSYAQAQNSTSNEQQTVYVVQVEQDGSVNKIEPDSQEFAATTNTINLRSHQHHQQQQQQQQQASSGLETPNLNELINPANGSNVTLQGAEQQQNEGGTRDKLQNIVYHKAPPSYKYPILAQYYEFGPWISRNRRAICRGCQLSTSSSQPDRLLKHLRRCNGVTPEDKVAVEDMMKDRIKSKMIKNKKQQQQLRRMQSTDHEDEDISDLDDDDDDESNGNMSSSNFNASDLNSSQLTSQFSSLKKVKLELDRKSMIDDALTKFIVRHRIQLKSIHSQEFSTFISLLNSDYKLPPQPTITNILIPRELKLL